MQIFKINILLVLIFLSITVVGQNKSKLEKDKRQALKNIEYTNKLIRETQKNQKESLNNLLLIKSKIDSQKKLMNNINSEISSLDNLVYDKEFVINMLDEDLSKLKKNYEALILIAYKNRHEYNKLMFILSAKDFNQAYRRLKYYQEYAKFRKKQVYLIQYIQVVLNSEVAKLEKAKNQKSELLTEHKTEAKVLKSEKKQQNKIFNSLSNKEEKLRSKLKKHEQTANRLQKEIERLIAEESKRNSGKSGSYNLTPAEKLISKNFGNNKGKLPWPVERGVIVSGFGKKAHAVLKNVTIDNTGIDIATAKGSQIRSIFNGEVRKVLSIPGAQNAVIIRHGNYLSVYTHLAKVYVKTGDQVKTKQLIGEVHTDTGDNKTIVHIEIWKESSKQNPAYWLAK